MRNFKFTRNPYLLFLPFLLFFIVFVLKFSNDALEGDEGGYIFFAKNILHGFYSPASPDINLWWGPGYPLILTPFISLGLPLMCLTLLNAVFQYLSIVLLFKAMQQFLSFRKSLIFSLCWAFCYIAYSYMTLMQTEVFTTFLIAILIYASIKGFNDQGNKYLYLAGFILGYIALTKVIFGYVLMFLLVGSLFLWLKKRSAPNYRKSALIMIIAFATTMPYLIYTYNLTGKLFYWGNSGGMSLYWMSTPYENEYGSWDNETFTANHIDGDIASNTSTTLLKVNHQKDIDEVLKYKGVEKDNAYKKIAIANIKAHPLKYIKNIVSNISNLLFGFPNTYSFQRPLLKIWYFSILFSLTVLSFILTIINWRKIPYSLQCLVVFAFLYLGGSSLVSGGNRQFIVIVPLLLLWIAYMINNAVTLKIKFDKNT